MMSGEKRFTGNRQAANPCYADVEAAARLRLDFFLFHVVVFSRRK